MTIFISKKINFYKNVYNSGCVSESAHLILNKKMQKNKKLVIGYCRVSTDDQANNGLSLDVQDEACVNAIKADGHKNYQIIRDEGQSGGSLKRPGIERIIRLTVSQEISAVYTISGDRLNRNTGDYLYLRELFRKNDVDLKYIY